LTNQLGVIPATRRGLSSTKLKAVSLNESFPVACFATARPTMPLSHSAKAFTMSIQQLANGD
jgi:hypothetical protein